MPRTSVISKNPTPNLSYVYDPYLPRLTAMTDGIGTTQYQYVASFTLGALRLQRETIPVSNSSVAYSYDKLGRVLSRTVGGVGAETFQYDALGRLTNHNSDLGQFTIGYLGQTGQVAQRQLASSTLATSWSYLPNAGDRRLAGITNVGLAAAQQSTYQFTTTPENLITAITETSDTPTAYPAAATQAAGYNNLNQLTSLSGQSRSYDANGNLLSDGQRVYAWDAENRLVKITYPAQPGKQTSFLYDGNDRRVKIISTPAGGGAALTTRYTWCGTAICQSRVSGNVAARAYYAEGEVVYGPPIQRLYYGTDQIGSVRRAFASTSSAPAYAYDPYGNALQPTALLTDFGYAWMLYNAESGLYLTQYRGYDPVAGRWLSRDPLDESSDTGASLYAYVGGNPTGWVDPQGTQEVLFGRLPPILENLMRLGRMTPDELNLPKETIPRISGKEGADNGPSWCQGQRPTIQESGKDFAKRLMDQKYGPGNWKSGPGSEYNQIQKWGDRSFRIPQAILDRLNVI